MDYGYGSYDALSPLFSFGCVCFVFLAGLAVAIFILYQVFRCYEAIPVEHRLLEPWQVWLQLIPLFGLVWQFFVYPRLGRSFRSYFRSRGTEIGDGLEQLGIWASVVSCCVIIPCVGWLFGLAHLVLLIIFLVKALDLRRRVLEDVLVGPHAPPVRF